MACGVGFGYGYGIGLGQATSKVNRFQSLAEWPPVEKDTGGRKGVKGEGQSARLRSKNSR